MSRVIYVHKKEHAPKVEHWAIFKFSTINIPGDERSRQAPGHGYPAHDEPVVNYEAYLDQAEWVAEVSRLESLVFGDKNFFAVKIIPATITHKVTIEVKG
jgi:hypothetical protein